MHGPDPNNPYPMPGIDRVGFLRPLIDDQQIEIGDYTYYDDPEGPGGFVERCVLYRHPAMGDRLVIGRYCAIAWKAKFIMNAANHPLGGLSTYPFSIFGSGWEDASEDWRDGMRGDTLIGNDVWIGYDATILPGICVGDGAVIAAQAVVSRDVPPYAVVAGNPARVVRMRYPPETVERLLAIGWWNWPPEKVTRNIEAIRRGNLVALEASAGQEGTRGAC